MLPAHFRSALCERGLNFSEIFLQAVVKDAGKVDTAAVLAELSSPVPYTSHIKSNGELVILIIREGELVTAMFRRGERLGGQPLTASALRVTQILDYRR